MLVIDSGRISLDTVSCRRDCSAPSPCLTGAGSSDKAQRASKHEPLCLELGLRSPGKSDVLKVSGITKEAGRSLIASPTQSIMYQDTKRSELLVMFQQTILIFILHLLLPLAGIDKEGP